MEQGGLSEIATYESGLSEIATYIRDDSTRTVHLWVGAAWCALLLACTTPWLARLSYFGLFGARAEGMFKQLIDAYEHAPAAPSVDQLLT